jgi:hypothetical protein
VDLALDRASKLPMPINTVEPLESLNRIRVFLEFHSSLVESSGNSRLTNIYHSISFNCARYQFIYFHIDIFQLELSIFYDMAILWNSAFDVANSTCQSDAVNPIRIKRLAAILRATAKAAFNLLEAYLNGMGLDILLTRQVSEKDKTRLTEWDEAKSRPSLLSLRDKLLQYPKIALQAAHPPINEATCPAMKRLLELEQDVRHALIHPTPRVNKSRPSELRERVHLGFTLPEAAEVVDCVIELILKLSETTNHMFGNVNYWLYRREPSGLFPNEALQ